MLTVLLALSLVGCPAGPCITPPPLKTDDQTKLAVSLAAKFAELPGGATLSTDFSRVVDTTFAQLNDNDAAYYMSLQAISCYLNEGKAGQLIALNMYRAVRDKYLAKPGANSASHPQAPQIKAMTDKIEAPKK